MKKYELQNQGIPLFVDHVNNLPAIKGTGFDSWYVICNFEADGKQYGLQWHQQVLFGQLITAEYLLMDVERNIWSKLSTTEPVSETSRVEYDKMYVSSSFGTLKGDHRQMQLDLKGRDGEAHVTLRGRGPVLYNGTTGLLKFLGGGDSFEYGYFNMDIEGHVIIQGKTVEIRHATAWFDRQWGASGNANDVKEGKGMNKLSWLWLGMPLGKDDEGAVSLWDAYGRDGRFTFATVYRADGTQLNLPAEVSYDDIWTSQESGNSYPRTVHISVPKEQLTLTLRFVSDTPEVVGTISGCQSLVKVDGQHHGQRIDRYNILEIVGDLCGEI